MKARALTIVWGRQHLDWFERALVASLALSRNYAALQAFVSRWDIVTRPEDAEAVEVIGRRLGLPIELHADGNFTDPPGHILQRELMRQMQRCLDEDCALLMLPPDSIFGDGSILTLARMGQPKGLCIAVPHVRATPRILEVPGHATSNAALVRAAWANLHRTWKEAEATLELTNTFAGGVSWRQVGDGLYGVQHLLPTVYWAQFIASDMEWWQAQTLIGAWDHRWPEKLVYEHRQRVIGSSDACFIAEVTPQFGNIPPVRANDKDEPDRFWGGDVKDLGGMAHAVFNRNHIAIFRAETA